VVGEIDYNFRELDMPAGLPKFIPTDILDQLISYDISAQKARELNDLLDRNGIGRPVDVDEGLDIMNEVIEHMEQDDNREDIFTNRGGTEDMDDLIEDDESEVEDFQDDQDEEVDEIDDETDPVIDGREFNKIEDIAEEFFGDFRIFDRFVDDTDNIDGDDVERVVNRRTANNPVVREQLPPILSDADIRT
jgi:hypothetical protein